MPTKRYEIAILGSKDTILGTNKLGILYLHIKFSFNPRAHFISYYSDVLLYFTVSWHILKTLFPMSLRTQFKSCSDVKDCWNCFGMDIKLAVKVNFYALKNGRRLLGFKKPYRHS